MTHSAPHLRLHAALALASAASQRSPSPPLSLRRPAAPRALGATSASSPRRLTAPRTCIYGWPVKPFDRQHPVRAFLNDPRIGHNGGRAFHFGIDVSAPDGTAGLRGRGRHRLLRLPRGDRGRRAGPVAQLRVLAHRPRRQEPPVRPQASADRLHRQGLGARALRRAARRRYVNPLRNGGLGPYTDHTAPDRRPRSRSPAPTLVAVASRHTRSARPRRLGERAGRARAPPVARSAAGGGGRPSTSAPRCSPASRSRRSTRPPRGKPQGRARPLQLLPRRAAGSPRGRRRSRSRRPTRPATARGPAALVAV